jgi:hypothetical protein
VTDILTETCADGGVSEGYADPTIAGEHCAVNNPPPQDIENYDPDFGEAGWTYKYTRNADTVYHLQTGGKSGRQNLWKISGGATEILDPHEVPGGLFDESYPCATADIPSQNVMVMGQSLGTAGYFYKVLPDGDDRDITPHVDGKDFYTYSVGTQKYNCYFTAYAEEPNPGGGRHGIVSVTKFFAGHGWWCLSSDAPAIGLYKAGISTASLAFLNDQVGYFPLVSLTSIFIPEPGILKDPGGASTINAQYTWDVGFNGLKGGLDFTANLFSNPGEYSLYAWPNNCVTTTIQAGIAAGVSMPNDTTPQNLGIDLNALWVLP